MINEVLIFLGIFVISISTEPIVQCVDDDWTEFQRDFGGVKYCYKWQDANIVQTGFSLHDAECKKWKDGGRMNSIHSPEEWTFHQYIMNKHLADPIKEFWVGLISKTFISGGNCDNCDKVIWMDKDNDDCTSGNWLNDNIQGYFEYCDDDQMWCWWHSVASGFKWTTAYCDEWEYHSVCKYKFKKCGTYWADETEVCNNHGVCLTDDLCLCEFLYTGNLCEHTHECDGTRQDDPLVCSGNGNCTSTNFCVCEEGFFGDTCELSITSISVCEGEGEKIFETSCYIKYPPGLNVFEAIDNCTDWDGDLIAISGFAEETFLRENFGYFMLGLIKNPLNIDVPPYSLYPCTELGEGFIHLDYVTPTTYPVAKGNRIQCVGVNFCFGLDDPFFWNERDCEKKGDIGHVCKKRISQCSGILATDPNQCNKRGYCDGERCVCFNGYEGSDCGTWSCFGILHDFESIVRSPCSGHGECKGPNTCVCEENYGGVECEATFCNGIISTRGDVCNGHGRCVKFDECKCDDDYGGDNFCRSPYPTADLLDSDYGVRRKKRWDDTLDGADPDVENKDLAKAGPFVSCRIPDLDYVPKYGGPTKMRTWIYQHEVSNRWLHPMTQYEAEEYAVEKWYPDKGRLFPITHQEHRFFTRHIRLLDSTTSRDQDMWIGVRKTYKNKKDPDLLDCASADFQCLFNVPYENCSHPDNAGFLSTSTPGAGSNYLGYYCSTPTLCLRQNRRPQIGDMECESPLNWAVSYHLHWCNGIEEDDKESVCNGNGFCWEDDTCTCKGNFGYFGLWCETRMCEGVESNQDEVCSGNGVCLEIIGDDTNGECSCQKNWYGPSCNITSCAGKMTNETSTSGGLKSVVCSGHGVCYAPDKCFCGTVVGETYVSSDKYFGDQCDTTYCNYIRSDSKEACGGHGTCFPYDTCTCNSTEGAVYTGQFCEVYYCFEEKSTDFSTVCNGGGDCIDIDVCQCVEGKYWGEECEVTECFGYLSNDTDVCSGKGDCLSWGICTCDDINAFGNCSVPTCFTIQASDVDNVCGGNGVCIGKDNCTCTNPDFAGEECTITNCDGISSTNDDVCWKRGNCVARDVCECFEGLWGPECANFSCNGIQSNESNVCNSRGDCVDRNTCNCTDVEYDYRSFCEFFSCYGVTSDSGNVCNKKGSCVSFDSCDCTGSTDYFGKACYEFIDTSKDVTYYFDFLGGRRMIKLPYENELKSRRTLGDKMKCFPTLLKSVQKDAVLNNTKWLGFSPDCEFGNNHILVQMGDEAPLLVGGSTYLIEFIFQTVPTVGGLTHTYIFVPNKDEKDRSGFNPEFKDLNDDHEEKEEKDEDKDRQKDEGEGEGEGDSDGDGFFEQEGVIYYTSFGGGFIVLVICAILVLLCCCCVCCCLCCCLICGCLVVKIKKGQGGGEEEMEKELTFDWKQ